MKTKIKSYIEINKDNMLKDLAELIAIPSISEDLEQVAEGMNWVLSKAEELGFEATSVLDGQVGVVEILPEGLSEEECECLGILTHVDVVPADDEEEWHTNPFEAVIKDEKIFGRGTLDDKGMIIASLYAMKACKELGLPFKKKVQLIIGTQEEVDWTDMEAYVKEYRLPDYGFTPDGEYPICNIEKGVMDVTMEFYVKESCRGTGKEAKCSLEAPEIEQIICGTAKNTVPGKAVAKLSDGENVVANGKSVHSSDPERGKNALFVLYDKLIQLQEQGKLQGNKTLSVLGSVVGVFRSIFGEKLGLYNETEYYKGEFVHRNVFSVTIFNADSEKVEVNVNVRFPYGQSEEEIVNKFEEFTSDNHGKITYVSSLPAVFVSKESPFLKVLAEAYEDVTGLDNEFTIAYGGSYAKAMPNVVSWGPIFVGKEDTCHEPNEYISVKDLLANTEIFANSIAGIVFSEESFR